MTPTVATHPTTHAADWPFNRTYIYSISMVAALGGLMFGYDWVVIGGAELFYEKCFHLDHRFAGRLGDEQRAGRLPCSARRLPAA